MRLVSSGVLMWEVFTEGKMPFEQNANHEVVMMVSQGHRLYRPKKATANIYDLMQLCWCEVCVFCRFDDNVPDPSCRQVTRLCIVITLNLC